MALRDLFNTLFGRGELPSSRRSTDAGHGSKKRFADSVDEPAQICSPRVLLIIYNPTMDATTGRKLADKMDWSPPDVLVGRFIAEVLQASGGLVRYQVAERIALAEFPRLTDGFRYDAGSYADVLRGLAQPHAPAGIDYMAIIDRFNVLRRVDGRSIDEVWIMGFPHAGLYESVMGGANAFWCNAPPIARAASKRRFVIMGFSYERDLGEMLHSYNHRSEAILARVFDCVGFLAWAYRANRVPATIRPDHKLNLFERFMLFDQIAPGKSGVGSVHFAPNSHRDYDLGNPALVSSSCYDWLQFPNFKEDVRMVAASEWGGGSERGYQTWWMHHLPKTSGRQNGIHNNWWQYIANLDNVES